MDAGGGDAVSPATEEETIARKRSRRVSFAETTAVHVFDRDEDFETPPELRVDASPSPAAASGEEPGVEAEGEETEGEEEFVRPLFRFVREIDSSSPGSAAGSVASNDDDNFFGPVSTSFILSGRPSDSGMSDDNNNDITLDSTAFSLHFRNVVPPDDHSANSAGSLRTPNSASTDTEHLTELAGFKKIIARTKASGGKLSSDRDGMSDMSLVADSPSHYDYGKLSPTLNNLLQEVNRGMQPDSPKDGSGAVTPDYPSNVAAAESQHGEGKSHIGNGISPNEDATNCSPQTHPSISNPVATSTDQIHEDNAYTSMEVDIHRSNLIHEKPQDNCNNVHGTAHFDVVTNVETSAMLSPPYRSSMTNINLQPRLLDPLLPKNQPPGTKHYTIASPHSSIAVPIFAMMDAKQLQDQNHVLNSEVLHTPKTLVQSSQTPEGSISSLRSKRQQLFGFVALSKSKLASLEAPSLESELLKHSQRISALKDRMSKFRLPESPAAHNFRLPLAERNQLEVQPENILDRMEDHSSTISVSNNSPLRELKETSQASLPCTSPSRQELNEAIKARDTSCKTPDKDIQSNHGSNSLQDLDAGGRKRSIEQNGNADQERVGKLVKIQRSPILSPKQLASGSLSSPRQERNNNESHNGDQSVNVDWTKVVSDLSDPTKQVFSASICKLNMQQLDLLEDMLGKIQMARNYKRLATSMRIQDCWSDPQQKRLAEARSLHDKLLYEKAKLQINRLRRDKLHNKAQLTQSGIQECCYLKSKISQLCYPIADTAQMMNSHIHAVTNNQEELAIVTQKKHELNMLNQKVENLKSSLEVFCKIKGDLGCDEVIKIANEQLKMINLCRDIHQDTWLWELSDLVKRENEHEIVLNYCDLMFQRIILNTSHMSSIVVNNSLNRTKIAETFPSMNTYVAFDFVFKAEGNQRVDNLKCLQKKTMETSLLLGNLFDVLEEIRVAKMELLNLISAAFDFESCNTLGQLAFQLCFMNFKSAKKVTLTIDMTDLSRAVYPSDPSELQIKICGSQTTIAQAVLDELMVAIRSLQPGRPMIPRLCQTISRLVHASSS